MKIAVIRFFGIVIVLIVAYLLAHLVTVLKVSNYNNALGGLAIAGFIIASCAGLWTITGKLK